MQIILNVNPHLPKDDTTFHCIMDAVSSTRADGKKFYTILIAPGIYNERVELWRSGITLKGTGTDPADTVITASYHAMEKLPDGSDRGTFRSYTMLIAAGGVSLYNLTVKNGSGEPKECGQAIALYAEGDDITVENCRLEGRQDTLFTGPLPPKEIKPGGFTGPLTDAPRIQGHQTYRNCFISGDVDFIFGGAAAEFTGCEICSLPHDRAKTDTDCVQGYVTAPSTPEGAETGYIFKNCRFTSDGLRPGTVYLSRPWRNYAAAVFSNCEIGLHIKDEGFHDWDKPEAHDTVRYKVTGCHRPDGSPFIPTASFI